MASGNSASTVAPTVVTGNRGGQISALDGAIVFLNDADGIFQGEHRQSGFLRAQRNGNQ
jgi:hypothetical protein